MKRSRKWWESKKISSGVSKTGWYNFTTSPGAVTYIVLVCEVGVKNDV